MGSIVPKLNFTMRIAMSKGAIETDAMRNILVKWMPIYTAFLPTLDAEDDGSGDDIETILELQHDTGNKDVYPLYSGTDLGLASIFSTSTAASVALNNMNIVASCVAPSAVKEPNKPIL